MSSRPKDQRQLIFLWMIPRTCSTVFSKCMTFVDDVQVWMGPYLACYFNDTIYNPKYKPDNAGLNFLREKLEHTEKTEAMKTLREKMNDIIDTSTGIIDQREISWPWVKEQLEVTDPSNKILFVKDQAAAILNHIEFLPRRPTHHTFIIRHPREVFPSFRNMIRDRANMSNEQCDQTKMADLHAMVRPQDFFPSTYKLWKYLREKSGEDPIIVDAYDLLTNPEVVLPKYFEKVGIPFKERYLRWESGNVFGKWNGSGDFALLEASTTVFARAVKSVKFENPKRDRGVPSDLEWKLSAELLECVDAALPYYEEMYDRRLC